MRYRLFFLRYLSLVFLLLTATDLLEAQSFTVTEYQAVGSGARHVINADVNGDGRRDLITADETSNTVSVLRGNADGTFEPRLQYATGNGPIAVASADLNEDGKPDLVTANYAGMSFSLLLNGGDGSFLPAQTTSLSGHPLDIAVGDYNRDGHADVVVGWADEPAHVNVMKVYLGIGAGKFVGPVISQGFGRTPDAGEQNPYMTGFSSGDFDNDGIPDIAIIECCGGFDVEMGDVMVLRGRGDGTFDQQLVNELSGPRDVTTYDVDKDGYTDILVTFQGCHTPCNGVTYYRNNRNGGFDIISAQVDPRLYSELRSPVAADFDGDGLTDIGILAAGTDYASGNQDHASLLIFKGTSTGISSTALDFTIIRSQRSLWAASIGDWDKDGKPDVAIAERLAGSVFKLLNTGANGSNCAVSTADHTVTICTPAQNSTVTSPFRLVAKTTSIFYRTTYMRIYANNQAIFESAVSSMDVQLSLAPGSYHLRVVAWNSNGEAFWQDRDITVSSGGGTGCTLNSAQPSVTICEPTEGATTTNQVHLVAKTNPNQYRTTFMRVYGNGAKLYEIASDHIDTTLNLGAGPWRLRVVAWNSAGQSYWQDRNITVSVANGGTCDPPITNASIAICAPAQNAMVNSPVAVSAATHWEGKTISHMRVYVDYRAYYDVDYPNQGKINTSIALPAGGHQLVIVAWATDGTHITSATHGFTVQ